MKKYSKIIAIDFDGTICKNEWPAIGKPNWPIIKKAIKEQENGAALILWTCRRDQELEDAVNACKIWGLTFDAVNKNIPYLIDLYKGDPRKIGADEYWDDKAIRVQYMEEMGND